MCGVITIIVTSVEITERNVHDSLRFKPLVAATARNFEIEEVTADKAYSSRKNLEQVDRLGVVAYIPFKSNSSGVARGSGLWNRLYHYYHLHHETFLEQYHRRSLSESTFSMIKAKFGDALRSKTDTALTNELLCKVLCHNICVLIQSMYELGIPVELRG
jgi:transposase